jgi:hypothetical protein
MSGLSRVRVFTRWGCFRLGCQSRLPLMSTDEHKRILRREKKRRWRAKKRGTPPITGPAMSRVDRGMLGAIATWTKEKRAA